MDTKEVELLADAIKTDAQIAESFKGNPDVVARCSLSIIKYAVRVIREVTKE